MKTYICDSCQRVVHEPYEMKMKEFYLAKTWSRGTLIPEPANNVGSDDGGDSMTNEINGRTPEEIKKGLELCYAPVCDCSECSYFEEEDCDLHLAADVRAYIQQLERERDAAVRDMYHAASDGGSFCDICKFKGEACDERKATDIECWQWRGVEAE